MSASVVTIYNWALSAIGTGARVQLATEGSPEANECNLWYDNVRDQILRSAPWDSARSFKRLALSVERSDSAQWEPTDPAPGWRYAYAVPQDLIAPRYLSSYERFELGVNSLDQKVLYCNSPGALLCYTKQQKRVDLWEADLQAAIAFGLGAHIAMQLTGNRDKVSLVTAQAIDKILSARVNGANAPQFALETVPEHLAGRGYGGLTPYTPYIYPWAEFSVQGFASGTT